MRIPRRTRTNNQTDFDEFLEPGGMIPSDPARFDALAEALMEAQGGTTLGPIADVVDLMIRDGKLAEHLDRYAQEWRHRSEAGPKPAAHSQFDD